MQKANGMSVSHRCDLSAHSGKDEGNSRAVDDRRVANMEQNAAGESQKLMVRPERALHAQEGETYPLSTPDEVQMFMHKATRKLVSQRCDLNAHACT